MYLHHRNITFEHYIQEYEKRWNIDPRQPVQLQRYQERTLYTTWNLSYSHLEKEDPDAAKMLKLLAYFDNHRIWYDLFRAGITDSSPEWLREVIADDVNFDGVMGVLAEYYFLDVHQTSESWSMHNSVHDWTLAALNKEIDAKHYWYAFDCISASISDGNANSFANLLYSPLAAHATRLVHQRFCENDITNDIPTHQLHQASLIANLLRGQVLLLPAEQMYHRVLSGYENTLGADHTSTLDIVNNLGILYQDQGELDRAEQMYQRALAGYEKALRANHTSTLNTVNNLGNLYRSQGKLDQAEQMYQRALAGREKALGADHTSTLNTVNNLGVLYVAQDKLDQAEHMYQRALAGYEKALRADHTSTLNTVNNLGNLYRSQGKLDQAEQMYQRALAGREKALGADHTSTLNTVNNLGVLYVAQGKLDQAEHMYQRALDGYENALGANHTSTLNTVNNLGNLYRNQGKLDQAEQMYQWALAGREKALGADHTTTLDTVNNLGILYQDQGKLDQAEQMYHRAGLGKEKNNADVQMMETRKQVLGLEYSDALDLSLGAVSHNSHADLGDSDSSVENDSVFSVPVSISSTRTLDSGRGEMDFLLIQEFANLLHEDGVLFSLLLVGISKELIGFERMRNNFRRLLKHFASNLKEDILSESHRDLRSFVSSYSAMITRELFAITHIDEERKLKPQALKAEHETASVEKHLIHERKVEFYLQSLHSGGTAPQTNEAMEVLNPDDEESDQGSVAEEAGEDEPYEGSLQNLNQMKSFILESAAYHVLHRRLEEFVQPSLYSRLRDLVNRWSIPEHKNHGDTARYKLRNLVTDLRRVSPHEIHFERDQNISRFVRFAGHYQHVIERWAGEPWDWWPFPRCPRPLAESETRLRWKCVSI
jgi:tetratricopeptide (TPR) repeat protein